MHELTRIVDQLKRAYDGDAWHGPSVRGVLEGVDAEMASARPFPAAHTICELVLHMTSWTREVARRLRDDIARDPERGDWPVALAIDEAGWKRLIGALDVANAELVEAVESMDDNPLDGRYRKRARSLARQRRLPLRFTARPRPASCLSCRPNRPPEKGGRLARLAPRIRSLISMTVEIGFSDRIARGSPAVLSSCTECSLRQPAVPEGDMFRLCVSIPVDQ